MLKRIARNPLIDLLVHLKGNERACLWTEPLWGIPYNLYVPFVSVYMAALGMTPVQIGAMSTIFFISQMFWALLSGVLTDKLGRRRCTVIFDLLSWSVPTFLWMLAQDYRWFVAAALFNGMWRVTENSWDLLLMEDSEPSRLVRLYAVSHVAGLLAGFVAPLAYLLVRAFGLVPTMRAIYGFTFVLMTTKFIVLYFLSHETKIGERRMRFLQEYAEANGCTLYAALTQNLDHELFKNTRARRLVDLVERFGARSQETPVSELLSDLLDQSGYEAMLRTEGAQDRLDNLAELKQAIYEFETTCGEEATLEAYLARVALLSNADTAQNGDRVRLMTVHTAKGLEFPHVFLCGLEEGVFPSKKTSTIEAMEEERRLAFVAFTRAQQSLSLSESEGRNFDGSFRYPSRFLFNVDDGLLVREGEADARLMQDAFRHIEASERLLAPAGGQALLQPGDRVAHDIMGEGVIVEVDRALGAYVVQFDILPTQRRISFRAKLTRA